MIDHVDTIKQLVRAGLGASIIPARAARREVNEGTLRSVHVGDRGLFREVGVISARDRHPPAAVAAFIDVCRRFAARRGRSG